MGKRCCREGSRRSQVLQGSIITDVFACPKVLCLLAGVIVRRWPVQKSRHTLRALPLLAHHSRLRSGDRKRVPNESSLGEGSASWMPVSYIHACKPADIDLEVCAYVNAVIDKMCHALKCSASAPGSQSTLPHGWMRMCSWRPPRLCPLCSSLAHRALLSSSIPQLDWPKSGIPYYSKKKVHKFLQGIFHRILSSPYNCRKPYCASIKRIHTWTHSCQV